MVARDHPDLDARLARDAHRLLRRRSQRVDDPDERSAGGAYIAKLYGLTKAEAALADLLRENHSPSEIAEARNVSMATVRSQIAAIQQKVEARSLGDLLRTLGGFPRVGS